MIRSIALSLIVTLIASIFLPSLSAKASVETAKKELIEEMGIGQGIEIIKETNDEIVYRVFEEKENGEILTFEYNEVTQTTDNKDIIKTKIYEINNETDGKELIDNYITYVIEEDDGTVTFEVEGDSNSKVTIDPKKVNEKAISEIEDDNNFQIVSWSGWTQSAVHNIGYRQNFSTSRGEAKWTHYGVNKNRPLSNTHFDRFTREVDTLRSYESSIVTNNVIGLAVEIGNLVFSGQSVTWAQVQSIAKKVLRSLVGVAVLWDVYQWSMSLERATNHYKNM
jgi:hypothetical protein